MGAVGLYSCNGNRRAICLGRRTASAGTALGSNRHRGAVGLRAGSGNRRIGRSRRCSWGLVAWAKGSVLGNDLSCDLANRAVSYGHGALGDSVGLVSD